MYDKSIQKLRDIHGDGDNISLFDNCTIHTGSNASDFDEIIVTHEVLEVLNILTENLRRGAFQTRLPDLRKEGQAIIISEIEKNDYKYENVAKEYYGSPKFD